MSDRGNDFDEGMPAWIPALPDASDGTSLCRCDELVRAFRRACETADRDVLVAILHPEVIALTDGGGVVSAATRAIVGADGVIRFLLGVLRRAPGLVIREQSVNGQTGLVARQQDRVVGVVCLNVRGDRISDVWLVLNPDKLRRWNPV